MLLLSAGFELLAEAFPAPLFPALGSLAQHWLQAWGWGRSALPQLRAPSRD